ncbi:MAG: beta-xylosidase, partial [Acidobacteriaceae bacterium]|nr:beta-xylosidase [Acidobacteriaceae bacterium]
AVASRSDHQIDVMVWNYHDDDIGEPDATIDLRISDIRSSAKRVLIQHFRIDADHSNSYTVWKEMGSPQSPTPDQYNALEAAGQLQLLESPRWIEACNDAVEVKFSLPLHGISLVELTW